MSAYVLLMIYKLFRHNELKGLIFKKKLEKIYAYLYIFDYLFFGFGLILLTGYLAMSINYIYFI